MTQCVICRRRVSRGFAYFCRGCYHTTKGQLGISDADFCTRINRNFELRVVYPRAWSFAMVHERLKQRYPSLKPLAVILESILFLKMILRPRRKLKLCNLFQFLTYLKK